MKQSRNDDPSQGDATWAGYHPRAAVPALVVAGAASLVVWTGRWYLEDLSELADRIGGLALFALAWGVWPLLIAAFLYRTVTYTYRLTDAAVLIDFGPRNRPVPPVWLKDVTAVEGGADWLDRVLGVGWVEVRTADRAERMIGVRQPREFAARIRAAAQANRAV